MEKKDLLSSVLGQLFTKHLFDRATKENAGPAPGPNSFFTGALYLADNEAERKKMINYAIDRGVPLDERMQDTISSDVKEYPFLGWAPNNKLSSCTQDAAFTLKFMLVDSSLFFTHCDAYFENQIKLSEKHENLRASVINYNEAWSILSRGVEAHEVNLLLPDSLTTSLMDPLQECTVIWACVGGGWRPQFGERAYFLMAEITDEGTCKVYHAINNDPHVCALYNPWPFETPEKAIQAAKAAPKSWAHILTGRQLESIILKYKDDYIKV